MSSARLRLWLSPLTTVTFVAIGASGILMFFHVRSGAINVLHELAGLAFVVLGLLHVAVNWKCLIGYFHKRSARVALAIGLVVCLALLALGAGHEEHRPQGRRARLGQLETTPSAGVGVSRALAPALTASSAGRLAKST